jgi:hypothetical protein
VWAGLRFQWQRSYSNCVFICCHLSSKAFGAYSFGRVSGPMAVGVEAAIVARAKEIRTLSRYIGFFEFLAWSRLRAVQVLMLFGEHIVDLRNWFGPNLPPQVLVAVHRVIAVKVHVSGKILSSGSNLVADVNHFLIGVAVSGKGSVNLEAPASGPTGSSGHVSARRAALSAGWMPKSTNATGDCGIDCLAYHDRKARTPAVWKSIRGELADFMMLVRKDKDWHDVFLSCSEMRAAGRPIGLVPVGSMGSPKPSGASSLPPVPLGGMGPPTPPLPSRPPCLSGFVPPAPLPPPPALPPCISGSVPPPQLPPAPMLPPALPAPVTELEDGMVGEVVRPAGCQAETFQNWLQSLDADKLQAITKNYFSFKAAEEIWRQEHPVLKPKVSRGTPKLRHVASKLNYRLATGIAYQRWRSDAGKESASPLKDFMLRLRAYSGEVPKKDRVWLSSCIALSKVEEHHMRSLGLRSHGGRRPTTAAGRVPQKSLVRQRLRQGPPYKCPLIREMLWEWFVDIRRSLCTTISPKFVLCKARLIADKVLKIQRETGGFGPMPVLDKHWLLRWKRDKGVVFRKPNMRFKCSKPVLVERLRAMWLNLIRVRRLAERLFGNDLSKAIFGIDEKPIHFNEAGSKNMRTLEIVGATAVRLKENHAATRERASLMTCVTSCPEAASQPRRLPMEILFKAKSHRRTRGLEPPGDLNISIQWAEKGSYRQEHILRYLAMWLDPWTPARAAAHDYRILFLDVAKSHLAEEVLEFAWTRGFVTLLHYGCTTGICQVNDTDLHADFEKNTSNASRTSSTNSNCMSLVVCPARHRTW